MPSASVAQRHLYAGKRGAGLSSKKLARILEHVQSEADHLLGDLMLGQLYEAAKEQLTELNSPEGGCIICLEEFADTMTLEQQPSQLPCYHCFHRYRASSAARCRGQAAAGNVCPALHCRVFVGHVCRAGGTGNSLIASRGASRC